MKAKQTKKRWSKPGIKPIIIELPDEVVAEIDDMADADGRDRKNYIQRLIIKHSRVKPAAK